ncbi:MAG: YlxR family protein [Actinomycetaceae bacterium]|nr:YlxR family protein [Actinomycetaceae bacterium]
MTHVPIRTCVGCRQRAPKDDLIRCVYDGPSESIVVDPHRRHAGRGAWLHPVETCVIRAIKSRAFTRALKLGNNGSLTAFDEVALLRLKELSHPVRKSRTADE